MIVKENPLVSIIIPCYNHGKYIQETLQSCFSQSYKNIEIIIADDGSDDEQTIEFLNNINDKRITLLHLCNSGPSVARNKAIEVSCGDFIVPLDADDLICHDALENCIPILNQNHKLAVVYGNCNYFGAENYLRKQQSFDIIKQLNYNMVALCSVIRKSAFYEAGMFDENMSRNGLEDWEFWISVYKKGWEFHYIDKILFDIRVNYNSRTYKVANEHIEKLRNYVYQKHYDLVADKFAYLYHENKNLKSTPDYRLGHSLLRPVRCIRKLFK